MAIRVSIHDLRARLARLEKADLSALSVAQVQQRVSLIIDQIPLRRYEWELTGLYRARLRSPGQSFNHASELWYPPASVVRMGRLNEDGKPAFYAANTPHTAMFEMRPEVGQLHTVLLARPLNGAPVSMRGPFLGVTHSLSSDTDALRQRVARADATLRRSLGAGDYKKYVLVDRWLTEAITKPVPADRWELYKPTVALANLVFRAPVDAISYPSVATAHNGTNLCMPPSLADKLFTPAEAWEFVIDNVVHHPTTNKPLYRVKATRKSSSITADGSISWGAPGVGVGTDEMEVFARDKMKSLSEWKGE